MLPFLLMVYMALKARDTLEAPEVRAKIAEKAKVHDKLKDEDYLPLRDWLTVRIIGWRAFADGSPKYYAPFHVFSRNLRVVYGVLVGYLAAVTIAALLFG